MNKSSDLNFWQKIALEILWGLCRLVGIIPHWVQYHVVAYGVYILLLYICRYRVKVADMNLLNSFPELSEAERKKIRNEFYHYLAEAMVSTVALAGGNPKQTVIRKDKSGNYGRIAEFKKEINNQSWVALTAHYGLWEYFMFWAEFTDQAMVAVYHPLENRLFDILFRRLRNHKGVYPVASKETIRFCLDNKNGVDGKSYIVGLIADQNPPRRPNSEWTTFLNQDSIFFDGGEKIALKLKLPVYFVYQRRLAPGIYEYDYDLIHDGKQAVEPFEITRIYIKKLEQVIRENPSIWLWSHKRWKHKRTQ